MSGPSILLSSPGWAYFKFPPDPAPPALPPPSAPDLYRSPFTIDAGTYNNALHPAVPVTIGTLYAVTVVYLNAYNRRRQNRPWPISKTAAFLVFVVLHNVVLAVYSAVTFAAMFRALKRTIPRPEESGLVGVVDSLCKMQGPRGFGDAAAFNATTNTWEIKNKLIHLGDNGAPDPTDVGRLWNEGLAFWGWIFYLSKFYEVLDTFIILAKGKRSSTLQTYHHTGAMLCMWAGIRYMSPPIWMFVFINSFIHSLMYTYFTVSALGVRVSNTIKRTLTTLQITQFVVGSIFASLHLFVHYTVPVSTTYSLVKTITSAVKAAPSSASSALASATAVDAYSRLMKLAYRAAGNEGLAENVHDNRGRGEGNVYGPDSEQSILQEISETRSRNVYEQVPCIDTTGQSFAVWLNVIYLAPLTGLFVRFFIRSYINRTSTTAKHPTRRRSMVKSASDAFKGVDREIESLGQSAEDGFTKLDKKAKKKAKKAKEAVKNADLGEKFKDSKAYVEGLVKDAIANGKKTFDDIWIFIKDKYNKGEKTALEASKGKDNIMSLDTLRGKVQQSWEQLKHLVDEAKEEADETLGKESEEQKEVGEKIDDAVANGKATAYEAKEEAEDNVKKEGSDDRLDPADENTKPKTEGADEPEKTVEDTKIEPLAESRVTTNGESSYVDVKQEGKEESQGSNKENEKPNGEPNGKPKEGLSTTDPNKSDESYAEKMK